MQLYCIEENRSAAAVEKSYIMELLRGDDSLSISVSKKMKFNGWQISHGRLIWTISLQRFI